MKRGCVNGFSLVEICIALGIVAFVVVPILGLFAVGMDASRRATDDTLLASIATQAISRLREDPKATTASLPQELHYDDAGLPVEQPEDPYFYDCKITTTAPVVYPGSSPIPNIADTMVTATLELSWPAPQRAHIYTIHATLPAR